LLPLIWIPLIFSLTKADPKASDLSKMRDEEKHDLHWKDPPERKYF
jgi:hypothetical protein